MVRAELILLVSLEDLTRQISLLVSLSDADFVNWHLSALRVEWLSSREVVSIRLVVMLVN